MGCTSNTSPRYGDSELRIGPWMREHRKRFFLATKTGQRDYQSARDEIRRSCIHGYRCAEMLTAK